LALDEARVSPIVAKAIAVLQAQSEEEEEEEALEKVAPTVDLMVVRAIALLHAQALAEARSYDQMRK
jgi:hypothetical protein